MLEVLELVYINFFILELVLLFVFLSPLAENHKIIQVGRDAWGPANPTCC